MTRTVTKISEFSVKTGRDPDSGLGRDSGLDLPRSAVLIELTEHRFDLEKDWISLH